MIADEHGHEHKPEGWTSRPNHSEEHDITSIEPEKQDGFSSEALPDVFATAKSDWIVPTEAQTAKPYDVAGDVRASKALGEALKIAAEQDIGPPISSWSGKDSYLRFLDGSKPRTDHQILKVKKILGSDFMSSRNTSYLALSFVISGCVQRVVKRLKDPRFSPAQPPLSLDPVTIHFSPKELKILDHNGYEASLVRLWISTLLSRDSTRAASQFDQAVQLAKRQSCRTPLFLVLGILRRRNMTTSAFRSFMVNCVNVVDDRELDMVDAACWDDSRGNGEIPGAASHERSLLSRWLSLYEVFQRLVTHALRVHPDALEYLSTLWTDSMSRFPVKDSESIPSNAILTLFHNRFLLSLIHI